MISSSSLYILKVSYSLVLSIANGFPASVDCLFTLLVVPSNEQAVQFNNHFLLINTLCPVLKFFAEPQGHEDLCLLYLL